MPYNVALTFQYKIEKVLVIKSIQTGGTVEFNQLHELWQYARSYRHGRYEVLNSKESRPHGMIYGFELKSWVFDKLLSFKCILVMNIYVRDRIIESVLLFLPVSWGWLHTQSTQVKHILWSTIEHFCARMQAKGTYTSYPGQLIYIRKEKRIQKTQRNRQC